MSVTGTGAVGEHDEHLHRPFVLFLHLQLESGEEVLPECVASEGKRVGRAGPDEQQYSKEHALSPRITSKSLQIFSHGQQKNLPSNHVHISFRSQ